MMKNANVTTAEGKSCAVKHEESVQMKQALKDDLIDLSEQEGVNKNGGNRY